LISLEIIQRTFLQILRHGSGFDYTSLDAPWDAWSRWVFGHVLRLPRFLFCDEDATPSGFFLGVESPVYDWRCSSLGGDAGRRRFIRGTVISSKFAPRGDDAVVVNHAISSTRCTFRASAWAAFLPPGLLLENPSDFLPNVRN